LLGNTLPTGAILIVLILIFGPVSGAHFNPAVTVAFSLRGEITRRDALHYVAAQLVGALIGVWAAHLMFELPMWQLSTTIRSGTGQWSAEFVATFGLLLTIFGCASVSPSATADAVGLYITAAYWFTASTSFANPAVTIARGLSDTFAGIAPTKRNGIHFLPIPRGGRSSTSRALAVAVRHCGKSNPIAASRAGHPWCPNLSQALRERVEPQFVGRQAASREARALQVRNDEPSRPR
jgi:glycerol uptake facilitator-like aquaporin